MAGRPRSAAAATGAGHDELLGIGGRLPRGLRLPVSEFLIGHDVAHAGLLRPLERHAELVVGREEALNVGIAPRSEEHTAARPGLTLGQGAGAWQRDGRRQRESTHEHECSSGHVIAFRALRYNSDALS